MPFLSNHTFVETLFFLSCCQKSFRFTIIVLFLVIHLKLNYCFFSFPKTTFGLSISLVSASTKKKKKSFCNGPKWKIKSILFNEIKKIVESIFFLGS